MRFNTIYW